MYQKLIVASTLLLTAGSYAQNTKLNLAEGKKYEVTATVAGNTTIDGHEEYTDKTLVQTFEVKKTVAGKTDLVATLKRVIAKHTDEEGDMYFDTDDRETHDDDMGRIMELVNKPANFTVNKSGVIIKEEQAKSAFTSIIRAVNNMMLSGPALFCASLIGRPYTVGATWTDSAKSELPYRMDKSTGTFKVKSVKNNTAVIAFNNSATMITLSEDHKISMRIIATLKLSGELKMDLATGIILESNYTSDDSIVMEMNGKKSDASSAKSTITTKTRIL